MIEKILSFTNPLDSTKACNFYFADYAYFDENASPLKAENMQVFNA
jgi:hypothetical protein